MAGNFYNCDEYVKILHNQSLSNLPFIIGQLNEDLKKYSFIVVSKKKLLLIFILIYYYFYYFLFSLKIHVKHDPKFLYSTGPIVYPPNFLDVRAFLMNFLTTLQLLHFVF